MASFVFFGRCDENGGNTNAVAKLRPTAKKCGEKHSQYESYRPRIYTMGMSRATAIRRKRMKFKRIVLLEKRKA